MTPAQRAFVELEKRRDGYRRYLEELSAALRAVAGEVGLDGYFQDDEGIVYKIVIPSGKWMPFQPISYLRTKRSGESKGTLSAKEATEAGFKAGMR